MSRLSLFCLLTLMVVCTISVQASQASFNAARQARQKEANKVKKKAAEQSFLTSDTYHQLKDNVGGSSQYDHAFTLKDNQMVKIHLPKPKHDKPKTKLSVFQHGSSGSSTDPSTTS